LGFDLRRAHAALGVMSRIQRGYVGEILVHRWLKPVVEVHRIPQDRGSKLDFTTADGKRPDFLVDAGSEGESMLGFVDAKLHDTPEGIFALPTKEIDAYRVFCDGAESEGMIFAVIPKADPSAVYLLTDAMLTEPVERNGEVWRGVRLDHPNVLKGAIPTAWFIEAVERVANGHTT